MSLRVEELRKLGKESFLREWREWGGEDCRCHEVDGASGAVVGVGGCGGDTSEFRREESLHAAADRIVVGGGVDNGIAVFAPFLPLTDVETSHSERGGLYECAR